MSLTTSATFPRRPLQRTPAKRANPAPKLGATMTLDQRITNAAARVAVAWSNGDEQQAQEWQAEVTRLMDARDLIGLGGAFDLLKGSPDHSVVRHA